MNKYIYLKLITATWILSLIMLLVGCGDSDLFDINSISGEDKVAVKLNLNVPGISQNMTRAMDVSDENAIDMANLQILVFEKLADGSEVFRYNANITEYNGYIATLLVPKSLNGEQYRFVVLANADAQNIVTEGARKEDVLNQFVFSCAGKWNTSDVTPSLIPMWGEYGSVITITRERYLEITVHRALARVDVGNLFKYNNDSPQGEPAVSDLNKEEVWGLNNFKLKEVRVYRTKNQAYVASHEGMISDNEVVTPNIPLTAKYNSNAGGAGYTSLSEADEDPLVYILPVASDKFVREIYIPESINNGADYTMDNVPCLVIGGYYGTTNTSKVTYYRADFATYAAGKVVAYKPILRNHRYVFDIKKVKGEGFEEPEEALKSISANLELTVEEWNEVPMDIYVQGHYFFQIDSRDVVLPAKGTLDPEGIFTDANYALTRVPYTTNLQLNGENIKYKWESEGGDFKEAVYMDVTGEGDFSYVCANENIFGGAAFFTTDKKRITFGAVPNTEAGAIERYDVLHLKIENFQFSIRVTQKAFDFDYSLFCDETKVFGKYRENVPLNYTHFLEVVIEPNLSGNSIADFEKAEIEIKTEIRKGIQFKFNGTIEEGLLNGSVTRNPETTYTSYKIKLQGEGTPVKDRNDRLNPDRADGILTRIDRLRIEANSTSDPVCENTNIIFGYNTKRILAIGANASYRYGYMLEPNSGSRAFVDASVNFGVDPNSAVTMEQFPNDYSYSGSYSNKTDALAKGNAFHIEYMTAGRGMSGENIDIAYLNTMLSEFKPDIILTGQAIRFSTEAITAISNFVNAGGVMLMFNEYYPSAASINNMVGAIVGSSLTGANESLSQSEFLFKLPSGVQYKDDPILNSSFGDLRGQDWGTDGYFIHGFGGLPLNDLFVYNTRPGDGNPCFFRHKTKPFVFVGDGGFISNAQRYIGPTYQGMYDYCPFAIDQAYRPIARTNFLRDKTVINSKLFGNILAWAVDYAEFHGINAI